MNKMVCATCGNPVKKKGHYYYHVIPGSAFGPCMTNQEILGSIARWITDPAKPGVLIDFTAD